MDPTWTWWSWKKIVLKTKSEVTPKVGICGYSNLWTMSTDKWATSTSTRLSTKVWVKLLLLENALKLNFWGTLTNWKFEPSPRPHTHSDPTINEHTEQVKKLRIDYHDMHWTRWYRSKTLYHTEKQGFGYPWLSIKIPDIPTKTGWSRAQFYPLQNYVCFPRSPLG